MRLLLPLTFFVVLAAGSCGTTPSIFGYSCTVDITLQGRPGSVERLMESLGASATYINGPVYEHTGYFPLVTMKIMYNGDTQSLMKSLASDQDIVDFQISAP